MGKFYIALTSLMLNKHSKIYLQFHVLTLSSKTDKKCPKHKYTNRMLDFLLHYFQEMSLAMKK